MTKYEADLLNAIWKDSPSMMPVQADTQDPYEARELMQADDDGMFKQGE